MGQDAQAHLAALAFVVTGGQGRAEMALQPRKYAFGMRPAAVAARGKPAVQLGAVLARRLLVAVAARIQFDGGQADAEFLARKAMVVFAVVSGVGEQAVQMQVRGGLPHGGIEIRRILARPPARADAENDVRIGVRHGGELGPVVRGVFGTALVALGIVAADMAGLKAGGVDRAFGALVDQAASARTCDGLGEDSVKAPFFRSFRSA